MNIRVLTFIWFIFSWSIIVFSKFDPVINQIILKFIIPLIFINILLIDGLKFKINNLLMIYIVFFLYALFSIFYTVNLDETLKYLQQLLGNIIIWYITFRLFSYFPDKRKFFKIMLLAYVFHAIYALIFPGIDIEEKKIRMVGLFTNSNALGVTMYYGLILLYLVDKLKKKSMNKIIFFLLFILFSYIVIETGSRKSALALLLSVLVILYYIFKNDKKKIYYIVPVVIIGIYSIYGFIEESILGKRLNLEDVERSTGKRGELINQGITFFIENPFIGIGLGSFKSYSSSGFMSHNDYIEILSSMGLIGLLIYISIYLLFIKDVRLIISLEKTRGIGIITLAFILGYLILGMGRTSFLDPAAILVFASFNAFVEYEINISTDIQLDK